MNSKDIKVGETYWYAHHGQPGALPRRVTILGNEGGKLMISEDRFVWPEDLSDEDRRMELADAMVKKANELLNKAEEIANQVADEGLTPEEKLAVEYHETLEGYMSELNNLVNRTTTDLSRQFVRGEIQAFGIASRAFDRIYGGLDG